jgi:bifunctional DNA-binding transcriptional regulator/antitoxin component of YhaV-PrlF toxin-antitoxin module
MTTDEFERSLKETEHSSAAFFSCSPSQRSFSSPELKHGIWTYHLCRALSGKDSDAFARDRIVTTASLKDYLSHTVPKFIREKTDIREKQRPTAVLNSDGVEICRFRDSGSARQNTDDDDAITLDFRVAIFRSRRDKPFRRMSGFKPGTNRVPDRLARSADDWAERLCQPEIEQEIDTIQNNARQQLGLKRQSIKTKLTQPATVETELFRFEIYGGQHAQDPSLLTITRKLSFKVPLADLPESFDAAFPVPFDQIVIPFYTTEFNDTANAAAAYADVIGASFSESASKRLATITLPGSQVEITLNPDQEEICIEGFSRGVIKARTRLENGLQDTIDEFLAKV